MSEAWESHFRRKSRRRRRRTAGWTMRSVLGWVAAELAVFAFVVGLLSLFNPL